MNAITERHGVTAIATELALAGILGPDTAIAVSTYLPGPEFDRWVLRIDETRYMAVETRSPSMLADISARIEAYCNAIADAGLESQTHVPTALASGLLFFDRLPPGPSLWDILFDTLTRPDDTALTASQHRIMAGYRHLGEFTAALHRAFTGARVPAMPRVASTAVGSVSSLLESPSSALHPSSHLRRALLRHDEVLGAVKRASEVEDFDREHVSLHGRLTATSVELGPDAIVVLGGPDAGIGHPRIDIGTVIAQLLGCSNLKSAGDRWGCGFAAAFIHGYGESFDGAIGSWQSLEDYVIARSVNTLLNKATHVGDGTWIDTMAARLAERTGNWFAAVREVVESKHDDRPAAAAKE